MSNSWTFLLVKQFGRFDGANSLNCLSLIRVQTLCKGAQEGAQKRTKVALGREKVNLCKPKLSLINYNYILIKSYTFETILH